MDIKILSSGRPLKQTTYDNFPPALQERATIVVPQDEAVLYTEQNLPAVGIPVKGIGKSRQWCLDNSVDDHVVMLDDDLVFATRRMDDPTKFRDATHEEVINLIDMIDSYLTLGYAHVGVATREGGNRNIEQNHTCSRMLRVLAYDRAVLAREGIRYDRMEVMEDFDVTLQLLRAGYTNVILNHMVQNQNGSNLSGGCSQYRTLDVQAAAAHKLHELHPSFVTVVKKDIPAGGAWGQRTDVRIQWKKAYESSNRAGRVLGDRARADTQKA